MGAFDNTFGGITDAFVSALDVSGSSLRYSTYLGGSNTDYGSSITIDSSGYASVTGITDSTDFPTTTGAFDTTASGTNDAFVTRVKFWVPNGSSCTTDAQCVSDICEDGICCAVSCGLCLSCESSGTTCAVVPADDEDCGIIDCDSLSTECHTYQDLASDRCEGAGDCKDPNSNDCTLHNDTAPGTDCGSPNDTNCDDPDSCDGSGNCETNHEPDGTLCPGGICHSGLCMPVGGAGGSTTIGGAGPAAGGSASGPMGGNGGVSAATLPGSACPEQCELLGRGCTCRIDPRSGGPSSGPWLLFALVASTAVRQRRRILC